MAGYFDIEKVCELLTQSYYCLIFRHNVNAYVKSCNVYLASKLVCSKLYNNLQLLPVQMY